MDRYRALVLRAALLCSMFGCAPAMTAEIPLFTPAYREMFGADIRNDENLVKRNDPGTGNVVAAIGKADMRGRDEHLLATILQAIGSRKRVLVVYGQSHWVTLSAALQATMGKPVIR
jgi:hypothetical protein